MDSSPDSPAARTMATFDAPRTTDPTRLAFVADPHLPDEDGAYGKLHQAAATFERALADADRRGVDHLLSVGDLTREGMAAEFDAVDAALADLNAPFTSVPGNHDVPNDFDAHEGVPVDDFVDRYAPGDVPFAIEVGDLPIVGLDTASAPAVADSHDGYVPESQVAWADDVLDGLDDAVVVLHHNLPDAVAQFESYCETAGLDLNTPPVLRDPGPLVNVLASHDVSLVFSGHLHIPGIAVTEGVREVLVPSTCNFPQAYLVVDVDRSGTTVEYVPLTDTDESTTALEKRTALGPKPEALSAMAAARLASFPLDRDG